MQKVDTNALRDTLTEIRADHDNLSAASRQEISFSSVSGFLNQLHFLADSIEELYETIYDALDQLDVYYEGKTPQIEE